MSGLLLINNSISFSGSSSNRSRNLAIGLGVGFGGIIIACAAYYCLTRMVSLGTLLISWKQTESSRNVEAVDTEFKLRGGMTVEEIEIAKKIIMVGLWCIQTIPSDRPSMSKVIDMMEGNLGALENPPRPYLSSSPPIFPFPSSMSTSSFTLPSPRS
ncbi:hypothetical protein ACFE04_010867 [Oxalis oulophora]